MRLQFLQKSCTSDRDLGLTNLSDPILPHAKIGLPPPVKLAIMWQILDLPCCKVCSSFQGHDTLVVFGGLKDTDPWLLDPSDEELESDSELLMQRIGCMSSCVAFSSSNFTGPGSAEVVPPGGLEITGSRHGCGLWPKVLGYGVVGSKTP